MAFCSPSKLFLDIIIISYHVHITAIFYILVSSQKVKAPFIIYLCRELSRIELQSEPAALWSCLLLWSMRVKWREEGYKAWSVYLNTGQVRNTSTNQPAMNTNLRLIIYGMTQLQKWKWLVQSRIAWCLTAGQWHRVEYFLTLWRVPQTSRYSQTTGVIVTAPTRERYQ